MGFLVPLYFASRWKVLRFQVEAGGVTVIRSQVLYRAPEMGPRVVPIFGSRPYPKIGSRQVPTHGAQWCPTNGPQKVPTLGVCNLLIGAQIQTFKSTVLGLEPFA